MAISPKRGPFAIVQLCSVTLALIWANDQSLGAYLDPGTGYSALQVLLGGIAAALVAVRMFWTRIVAAVTGFFHRPAATEPRSDD